MKKQKHCMSNDDPEALPLSDPKQPFQVSQMQRYHIGLSEFIANDRKDPAVNNFIEKLLNHILVHLGHTGDPDHFSHVDWNSILIINNEMYEHKVLCTNYTSYDIHIEQDTINPCTRSDIMVLVPTDEHDIHPYCLNTDSKFGFEHRHLPHVGFLDCNDAETFGFIDPASVIHAAHLIPNTASGTTSDALPAQSIACRPDEDVGHHNTYEAAKVLHEEILRAYNLDSQGFPLSKSTSATELEPMDVFFDVGLGGDGDDSDINADEDSELEEENDEGLVGGDDMEERNEVETLGFGSW
ncbi:hypothetical protein BT96DRAFT_1005310 [Gymnopus androsaceus JB14]|uniref:Uncharacterized protein n=1 Tax=Gymnopus androsaceus JB14 TaxID=1447944 RepID=A0A6A4GPR4_9AGAR|nr:hypothetical protein BT96DRAFT_1005310 [Gymnopus androsaceus JB14]